MIKGDIFRIFNILQQFHFGHIRPSLPFSRWVHWHLVLPGAPGLICICILSWKAYQHIPRIWHRQLWASLGASGICIFRTFSQISRWRIGYRALWSKPCPNKQTNLNWGSRACSPCEGLLKHQPLGRFVLEGRIHCGLELPPQTFQNVKLQHPDVTSGFPSSVPAAFKF